MYWTLTVRVESPGGKPLAGKEVSIADRDNAVVSQARTDSLGLVNVELPEYKVNGKEKVVSSPYTVEVEGVKREVTLDSNKTITSVIK